MGIYSLRLPDIGEGVAEAELVEWNIKVGDTVLEDDIIGSVMTDKAAVEIPVSVTGKVIWLGGEVGDIVAVGAELMRLEVDGAGNIDADQALPDQQTNNTKQQEPKTENTVKDDQLKKAGGAEKSVARATDLSAESPAMETSSSTAANDVNAAPEDSAKQVTGGKPLAAPSVRKRARDMGVDLHAVTGSGPAGRIVHDDLDNYDGTLNTSGGRAPNTAVDEIKVVGLRRLIANKMSQSKKHIPHITIVEEIDVTSLEQTREELNGSYESERGKLTVLPFIMKAVVEAVREQPIINAIYDDDAEVIHQHGGVHIGIATQTDNGLMVPVVKHCEVRSLWNSAAEVARLAGACRNGSADREELSGSTITISSLGPMGAIATTPIINYPEVAIVGINKMVTRPVWDGQQFVPRKMMNISCAFDHRVVDGWDAAVLVQKLKTLLESPAMLLVET